MRAPRSLWICAGLIAPVGVGVEVPSDSLPDPVSRVTTFRGAAGGGENAREIFVSVGSVQGCEGSQSVYLEEQFFDIGGEVDHQVSDAVHFGARAGYISEYAELAAPLPIDPNTNQTFILPADVDGHRDTFYLNPFMSLEGGWIGAGVGVVGSTEPLNEGERERIPPSEGLAALPSFHLRLGKTSLIYASGHIWEGVPIYSGGGQGMLGVGIGFLGPFDLWAGKSHGGPYREDSWICRLGADLNRNWSLDAAYRFQDKTELQDADEWGFAAGFRYRLYRP